MGEPRPDPDREVGETADLARTAAGLRLRLLSNQELVKVALPSVGEHGVTGLVRPADHLDRARRVVRHEQDGIPRRMPRELLVEPGEDRRAFDPRGAGRSGPRFLGAAPARRRGPGGPGRPTLPRTGRR